MFTALTFISLLCCVMAEHWCCNTPKNRQAMLDILLKDNNHDGNGYVSAADMLYDLKNNYDYNKDGKVTLYEWVKRFNCQYGDSFEYSEWLFKQLSPKDVIDISAFQGPPDPGLTLAAFREMNAKRYVTFANTQKT